MTKARRSIVSKSSSGGGCGAWRRLPRGEATQATGGAGEVEVTTQALTTVDIDRALGFEATTVTDWSIIQSGPGTLSVSTTASQGSRSLAVASRGYVPVQSVALSSLGSRVGSVIHYDIMSPTQLKQISPGKYGATQLYLNSTSLGLNNVYLGQVELSPLPLGQWNTVTFTPTSSVLTKLRGTYTDLRVTIVVNAPYNATQPYLLDNLRFSDSTLALVTVVDSSGHAISGLTVVAYNGATPTSNTGVTDSTGLAKVWVPPGSYRFGVTDAGVTTYSSPANQCQVPGICVAATITDKCHSVVCSAKDVCHNVGTCDPGTGVCSNPAKPAGTVCRASAGPCDVAEVCDGTAAGCPADHFAAAATVCRAAAGPCDLAETCTGTGAACPADALAPATTVCRASAGPCDLAESCTGTSAACPADTLAPTTTVCRASVGPCDLAENCTGASAACPADALAPPTTVCRASAGPCDLAESCTGASAACPADGFLQASLACRPSAGPCDVGEICSGTSAACPTDTFLPAATICRPAAGVCDAAEKCGGASAACPADMKLPDGTACDDGNACTKQDKCTNGVCAGTADPVVTPKEHVSFTVNASFDAASGTSADGQEIFVGPTMFTLPGAIPVVTGLGGNGTATLTFHSATTCGDVTCIYRGGSSTSHAVTPVDEILGKMYFLQSCSDGIQGSATLAVTSIALHVASGDTGTPLVAIQILVSYPDDVGGTTSPTDAGRLHPS